jgi:hypothetical protein
VPSFKTLRNWEIDFAGGCLAQVIEQIRQDATRMRKWGVKLEITLVTDHGNQEGVDHFVKMICWSSVDKHGNQSCAISPWILIRVGIQPRRTKSLQMQRM